MALYLVGTFAFGVALGGVGVAKFQERRTQQAQAATVAVDAIAGPTSEGTRRDGNAEVDAKLTVVNAGSIPVVVRFVGARETGVLVRDTGQSLLLLPGSTGGTDVRLIVDCRLASPDPLPMRFSVQTPDQGATELTTPVEISAWHERADAFCNASPAATG
ncbi:hypothetical protein C1I95_15490 [Micromonospora craterilacus]|uniref:Uncharacterized protein n=1 Tax=Micromonospora craterilacus TaxID=1655439 RepID=A0A2W2E574_9ACTN|nr:hypothetical protein C1I95_15490 [Micromonospora craterilacus]